METPELYHRIAEVDLPGDEGMLVVFLKATSKPVATLNPDRPADPHPYGRLGGRMRALHEPCGGTFTFHIISLRRGVFHCPVCGLRLSCPPQWQGLETFLLSITEQGGAARYCD